MQKPYKIMKKMPVARGFSLVELMVALALSLIVMAGIIAIFANTKSVNQTETGLSRLQENARFSLNIMTTEIRKAGYLGCLRDISSLQSTLNSSTSFGVNYAIGVQGFEANGTGPTDTIDLATPTTGWTPALVASIPSSANTVLGSDVVVIRRLDDTGYRLVPPYNDGAQVFVESNANFQEGDILMATDCSKATVFQVTATNNGATASVSNLSHSSSAKGKTGTPLVPGNSCNTWGSCGNPQYSDGSEIAKATTTVFYLRKDTSDPLSALYMASASSGNLGAGIKLIDGVESMQILYGIDRTAAQATSSGIALRFDRAEEYMTATQVTAANLWPNVVTVRISLLLRTINEPGEQAAQTTDAKTYNLAGTRVTPVADQNRRRVFTSTILIRNRILPGGI